MNSLKNNLTEILIYAAVFLLLYTAFTLSELLFSPFL